MCGLPHMVLGSMVKRMGTGLKYPFRNLPLMFWIFCQQLKEKEMANLVYLLMMQS
jgi:hypothetical protein